MISSPSLFDFQSWNRLSRFQRSLLTMFLSILVFLCLCYLYLKPASSGGNLGLKDVSNLDKLIRNNKIHPPFIPGSGKVRIQMDCCPIRDDDCLFFFFLPRSTTIP